MSTVAEPPAAPPPAAPPPAAPPPSAPPPSAPPPSQGPIIGPDGNFIKGWSKQLEAPETLEAKFTSPKALAKSYGDLEKLISAKGIIKPGPNATPEEKASFFKELGRPEKPEDYGIKMPDKVGDQPYPKEFWNPKLAEGAAKVFHAAGLTKEQADMVTALHNEITMGAKSDFESKMAQQRTENMAALKAAWPGAEYDTNLALAKKAAEQAGGAELLAHPLANDPMFIKAMAKVGAMIVEQPAAGARGTSHAGVDPKAEIQAIMNDKNHPWQPNNAKLNPKAHDDAVKHMARLYQLAYPG